MRLKTMEQIFGLFHCSDMYCLAIHEISQNTSSLFENLYKYTDIRRAGSEYHPFTAELISFSEANYFMEALKYLMRA